MSKAEKLRQWLEAFDRNHAPQVQGPKAPWLTAALEEAREETHQDTREVCMMEVHEFADELRSRGMHPWTLYKFALAISNRLAEPALDVGAAIDQAVADIDAALIAAREEGRREGVMAEAQEKYRKTRRGALKEAAREVGSDS